MSKPTPYANLSATDLTNAISLAIAAGKAAQDAEACRIDSITLELMRLSLRFSALALEALGGEAGQACSDEAASA